MSDHVVPKSETLDLVKANKAEYATPRDPAIVRTRRATYLSVTGTGAPGGSEFQEAIGLLYSMAYTLKFLLKERSLDFKVGPLEGIWTGRPADMRPATLAKMGWQLLIRVPDAVSKTALTEGIRSLEQKGRAPKRPIDVVKLREGKCLQVLHVGPYDKEAQTVARLQAYAASHGLRETGTHHEVFLSDPRRVPAARLRTILRHPVAAAGA